MPLSEKSSIFPTEAEQRRKQLTSAAVAARTRLHSNNEKSDCIKSTTEEEDVGKEDKMLSRVAFRAGESV